MILGVDRSVYGASDVDGWAERHGITLDSVLDSKSEDAEFWTVSATTHQGRLALPITTDGSYQPDPFEQLFGVWMYESPSPVEFNAAVGVLGAAAVGELAELLGW